MSPSILAGLPLLALGGYCEHEARVVAPFLTLCRVGAVEAFIVATLKGLLLPNG